MDNKQLDNISYDSDKGFFTKKIKLKSGKFKTKRIYGLISCKIGIKKADSDRLKNVSFLPCRFKGKVIFANCNRCLRKPEKYSACLCTDDQRAFCDTYTVSIVDKYF